MEERKRRFGDPEVIDAVRDALQRVMGTSSIEGVHYFTPAADVQDDWSLRLVILSPSTAWTRSGPNPARDAAMTMLRERGGQPRQKQNRLLFLAADSDQVIHLKETVRALLAWQSIESDIRELRLNLDALQSRQATQNREQARDTTLRLVRDTFKWLVVPGQSVKKDGTVGDVEWEALPLNPATQGMGKEIDRVLAENELVISEWAPVHLHNLLKKWFWKDDSFEVPALDVWQKSCSYLYFPRLAKSTVMQSTIAAGATSRDFFGIASDKLDGVYRGFVLGKATTPFMDALLLIEPKHAATYEASISVPTSASADAPRTSADHDVDVDVDVDEINRGDAPRTPAARIAPTRFYATAELDAVTASLKFSTVVSELVELFSSAHGTRVRIRVDIEAEDARGFSEGLVRAANENSKVLGMKTSEFE